MADAGSYEVADTDWFASCPYGVSVHWTALTMPRRGDPAPFRETVEAFDVGAFAETIAATGAGYLIFTATHALQMLPAPNPVLDGILSGRTCERDLIAELAAALAARGIHLILYYNHSCNSGEDPEWERAVGYHDPDKNRLADNLCELVGWMGSHYGPSCKAWWFDSSYSLDPGGPHNSVTTDMSGFRFPWERFTAAAKRGFPDRLVTYNAGVDQTYLYTTHQDYWAGEMNDLEHPPTGRFAENGLQWHGWTFLDDLWVHGEKNTGIRDVLYSTEQLAAFVGACRTHKAPMTFNLGVYRDGTMSPRTLEAMKSLAGALADSA